MLKKYIKEDFKKALQDFYVETNKTKAIDYVKWGMKHNKPCTSIICKEFGSWNNVIKEVFLKRRKKNDSI